MCRLFGFRSAVPSRAHKSLLHAENSVVEQSRLHPHGWGIGWFAGEEACVVKSGNAAHDCERFLRASSALSSHTMVVHVRRATVGVVDHMNAHPFQFGRWVFAHNGTVFGMEEGLREWMEEQIDEGFRPMLLGDTDSECLFWFLLSALTDNGVDHSGRRPSDPDVVADIVRRALRAVDEEAQQRGLDRPIVNCILTNGTLFFAHRAGMPLFLSTQKHFCPDFETCPEPSKVCMELVRPAGHPVNHLLVASEAIGADENRWEPVPDGGSVLLRPDFTLKQLAPPEGWQTPELPERYRITAEERRRATVG